VVSPPQADEEAYLQMLLDAALIEAEAKQNRDLISRKWTLRVYGAVDPEVRLRAECSAIDKVTAYDDDGVAAELDPSTYYLDAPSSAIVFLVLPDVGRWVDIDFTTRSISPLPEHLRYGILLLAGWWYQQRAPIIEKSTGSVAVECPFAVSHLLRKGAWQHAAVF
jgi:uncharacterized phiE125 gp8 family phage protein